MRVLIVSSFVPPHVGGVERFAAWLKGALEKEGHEARTLACDHEDAEAEATVPTRFVGESGWPLVTGGLSVVWREVGRADLVVVNGHRHPLPVIAALVARARRRRCLFVVHAADTGVRGGIYGALALLFDRLLARLALKAATPVAVSHAGADFVRRHLQAEAAVVPYPVDLEPVEPKPLSEPARLVWVGRLSAEKAPELAVAAAELVREERPVILDVYGDGPLRARLAELAAARPWLRVHGERPWEEVTAAQAEADVCLSTSVADNAQVAVLEALVRGLPTVTTNVGEASYYFGEELAAYCVKPHEQALGTALRGLLEDYETEAMKFAAHGDTVRGRHRSSFENLMSLAPH